MIPDEPWVDPGLPATLLCDCSEGGNRMGRKERNADYRRRYSERAFWRKLSGLPRTAGMAAVERAVTLYVVLTDRDTPLWARALVIAALGYFIYPLDAVPDAVPLAGLADAVAMMGADPYDFRSGFNGGISFCEDTRPEAYPRAVDSRAKCKGSFFAVDFEDFIGRTVSEGLSWPVINLLDDTVE
ncbi:MAG: DUF1232 domain-containing protein, partial [Kiritimatiellae bacterium]|nr:DUF1232 domain-containing protein [Kiritimatiellia bacterium]